MSSKYEGFKVYGQHEDVFLSVSDCIEAFDSLPAGVKEYHIAKIFHWREIYDEDDILSGFTTEELTAELLRRTGLGKELE